MAYPNITYMPSQSAMLAQPWATVGDFTYREDLDITFQLNALPSSVLNNWQPITGSSGGGGGGLGPIQSGNGTNQEIMFTTLKGTGGGPNNPTAVVGYASVFIGGQLFWVPLFQ